MIEVEIKLPVCRKSELEEKLIDFGFTLGGFFQCGQKR